MADWERSIRQVRSPVLCVQRFLPRVFSIAVEKIRGHLETGIREIPELAVRKRKAQYAGEAIPLAPGLQAAASAIEQAKWEDAVVGAGPTISAMQKEAAVVSGQLDPILLLERCHSRGRSNLIQLVSVRTRTEHAQRDVARPQERQLPEDVFAMH